MSFPKDFLWGGATATSQVEGGQNEGGKRLDTQGYEPQFSDLARKQKNNWEYKQMTSRKFEDGKACQGVGNYLFHFGSDEYHRYKEDIALFAEMGMKVHHLSISWARIYPSGDNEKPDQVGIEYYENVFEECHEHHVKVFVTMLHCAVPVHLVDAYGGWKNRKLVDFYLQCAKTLFKGFKDDVDYRLPFSEINAGRFNPYNDIGLIKDREEHYDQSVYQAIHHQFVANVLIVRLAHEMTPGSQMGYMIARFYHYATICNPADQLTQMFDEQYTNWFYTDIMARDRHPEYIERHLKQRNVSVHFEPGDKELLLSYPVDFVTFSYYFAQVSTADEIWEKTDGNLVIANKNPYLESSERGWQKDAIRPRATLNQVYDCYQKPIFATENGLGAVDTLESDNTVYDPYRIAYLKDHIKAMSGAVGDGVELLGHTMWGIIDLVDCGSIEMSKRYGAIYVDVSDEGNGTFSRHRKDSFY